MRGCCSRSVMLVELRTGIDAPAEAAVSSRKVAGFEGMQST